MSRRARIGVVLGLLAVALVIAAAAPPIPQDPAYHRMADTRTLWGVPHALNVLSNAAFLVAGALGLWALGRRPKVGGVQFLDERERWPYLVFFAGLFLTGLGSAYYHLDTGNERLMWDRLPLAVTFMGLFAAVIAERIDVKAGVALLGPLVAVGVGSVLLWHAGESRGAGDLRLYALVQFFPIVAIPVILLLFPPRYPRSGGDLLTVAAFYGAGKLCEFLDGWILSLGGVISGHSLKHLTAGLAGLWVWRMLERRRGWTAGDAMAGAPTRREAAGRASHLGGR